MTTACLLLGPLRNCRLIAVLLIWRQSQKSVQVDWTRTWIRIISIDISSLLTVLLHHVKDHAQNPAHNIRETNQAVCWGVTGNWVLGDL